MSPFNSLLYICGYLIFPIIFMKHFLLFVASLFASLQLFAGNAAVSVLTCSPGDEVYSLFGHTGLRYKNEEKGLDVVFSYGYFDFDSPNFVWRFVKGETDYIVGAVPYEMFMEEYEERGGAVVEQVLELTPGQEQELFDIIAFNCRLENRKYRYNYFYNNCTTKIRDQIARVASGLSYAGYDAAGNVTFRDELRRLTASHPWYSFGIDLMLGADIDKPATGMELQFIPENFLRDLEDATVVMANGETVPFVKEQSLVLVEAENNTAIVESRFTPFYVSVLLLLFTFIIMLCEIRSKRTFWLFDAVLLTLQGLCGVLLLFMALFSQHPAVDNNWAMLLLNPLMLVIMPVYVNRLRKNRTMSVAWVQVVCVLLFFLSAAFSLQVYPTPIYFCAVALLVRSVFNIYKERICDLSLY